MGKKKKFPVQITLRKNRPGLILGHRVEKQVGELNKREKKSDISVSHERWFSRDSSMEQGAFIVSCPLGETQGEVP